MVVQFVACLFIHHKGMINIDTLCVMHMGVGGGAR